MNLMCATCSRPLPPEPMPNVGGVRFCCAECIKEWHIAHSRRFRVMPVAVERRATA